MHIFCKRRFEDQRGAGVLAAVIGLFLACGAAKALAERSFASGATRPASTNSPPGSRRSRKAA